MIIAHTDPARFKDASNVHGGAGTIRIMSLLEKPTFQTPWLFIHRAVLLPGSGIGHHAHDTCEEMFTILDNAACFTHNGNTAEVRGAAMVPCRKGESHGIYNHTSQDTQFMNFCVLSPGGSYDCRDFNDNLINAKPGSIEQVPVRWIDRRLLTYTDQPAHQGRGRIGIRGLWTHEDFKTTWGFIHHLLISPRCSIGYHRHETIEECYMVLAGRGRVTVDDETRCIGVGDAVLNRLGGAHGVYNDGHMPLELLNMAVCLEKGKFDAVDLGDDLAERRVKVLDGEVTEPLG